MRGLSLFSSVPLVTNLKLLHKGQSICGYQCNVRVRGEDSWHKVSKRLVTGIPVIHSHTHKRNKNTKHLRRHLTYKGNPFFALLWYKILKLDHRGECPNQWFSPRLQQNYQGAFKNHQCLGSTQSNLESLRMRPDISDF